MPIHGEILKNLDFIQFEKKKFPRQKLKNVQNWKNGLKRR